MIIIINNCVASGNLHPQRGGCNKKVNNHGDNITLKLGRNCFIWIMPLAYIAMVRKRWVYSSNSENKTAQ